MKNYREWQFFLVLKWSHTTSKFSKNISRAYGEKMTKVTPSYVIDYQQWRKLWNKGFSGHYYKFLKNFHMKPPLLPLNLSLFKKKHSKISLKKCDWIYFLTLLKRWSQINIFSWQFWISSNDLRAEQLYTDAVLLALHCNKLI